MIVGRFHESTKRFPSSSVLVAFHSTAPCRFHGLETSARKDNRRRHGNQYEMSSERELIRRPQGRTGRKRTARTGPSVVAALLAQNSFGECVPDRATSMKCLIPFALQTFGLTSSIPLVAAIDTLETVLVPPHSSITVRNPYAFSYPTYRSISHIIVRGIAHA
ncbi:hypothetical protein BD310DRAFT_936555 [Dichomitus squalens]|uniref:Uncharacterized protein n=1 Tax=Dichomitus squalens TaxID=114155 RepID=A0A4Q9PJ61_9APHY|nr:hypothetical protein BD310DRAFT_936555 [Dichomitus squalens]